MHYHEYNFKIISISLINVNCNEVQLNISVRNLIRCHIIFSIIFYNLSKDIIFPFIESLKFYYTLTLSKSILDTANHHIVINL